MKYSKKTEDILERVRKLTENPHRTIQSWGEKAGKKVVLCAGLDVPEVLIEAAGMLPAILPEEEKSIVSANPHVQSHICSLVRSIVGQAVEGKLQYAEAVMISDACHELRMFGDLIPHITDKVKKVQFIYLSPKQEDRLAEEFTRQELIRVRGYLEEISGTAILDENISEAIRIYNENRQALLHLYEIRRKNPEVIGAFDLTMVVYASMLMPKEEHTLIVKDLINSLEETSLETTENKIPVIVSGSLCKPCEEYFFDAIEASGGVVVDDDLYVGSRYFNTLFDETIPPMEAIRKAYLKRTAPCPTRFEKRGLGEYLYEMAESTHAKGVINIIVQHCEPHYYGYFTEHRFLSKKDVPDMMFESEIENQQIQQVKTRIQSFFEGMEV